MRLDSLLGDLGVLGLTYKGGERPIATTDKALITDYFRVSLTKGVSSPLRLVALRNGAHPCGVSLTKGVSAPLRRKVRLRGCRRPLVSLTRGVSAPLRLPTMRIIPLSC